MYFSLFQGLLVIEPERRFSIDTVVNHPWTTKNSSPLTKLIIDQILNIKDPRAGWLVNETTVDSIVRTVGVTRESVIDSVRKNKCDDISALYHMVSEIMSCEQSPQIVYICRYSYVKFEIVHLELRKK